MNLHSSRILHVALLAIATGLALTAGAVSAGTGQWTSNGPYGGEVSVLAVDPKNPAVMYAAGISGIFKTGDGALTWSRASDGITDHSVAAIAIDPVTTSTLYAGSIQGGRMIRSTDAGASWTALATGPTLVMAIAIPVQSPSTIYVARQQAGLMKSTDGGATWASIGVPTLPSFPSFRSLAIDPTNPNVIYAGEQSRGVYKSSDGGATWAAANAGFTSGSIVQVVKLAIDPSNPATLYAAANTSTSGGLYKSSDGGASWTQTLVDGSGVIGIQAVVVDPTNSANVYVGTFGQGTMKSTTGGTGFAAINSGLPKVGVNVVAINPASPGSVFVGTENGVFASTNGGGGWTGASNGLSLVTVNAVAIDPQVPTTVYAATKQSGLWKSVDGGDSWTAINGGIGSTGNLACNMPSFSSLAVDPVTPSTLYAGTQCTLGSQVYKSTDGGANWVGVTSGLPAYASISAVTIDPRKTSTVFAGSAAQGLYRSIDGGAHWGQVAAVPATAHGSGISASRSPASSGVDATAVAFSTIGESLFLSADGGDSFSLISAPSSSTFAKYLPCLTEGEAVALGVIAGTSQIRFAISCGAGGAMVKAAVWANGAPHATQITSLEIRSWAAPDGSAERQVACSPTAGVALDPAADGAFYVAAACGVLRGTGDGAQVSSLKNGLPEGMQTIAVAVTASGSDVYAGARAGGVWRYTPSVAPLTPVTVVEFYNAALDHYFITWAGDEIANLDAGKTPTKWNRTGQVFKTYTSTQPGTSSVCRYYIPPELGDSHFFGRGSAECAATGQKNPSFVLESSDFMQMFLPVTGACPANTVNVYRVFSNRSDANHRYMTDKAIRDQMAAKGWLIEGDGPDSVVMCAPS